MSPFERKKLDLDFARFASRHFEKPRNCRNLDQIRFYVNELSGKIKELKQNFNYVPDEAYELLTKYNELQNSIIYAEFRNAS